MTKKGLFSGTNEIYIAQRGVYPDKWTTCPFDALNHSERSARRFNCKMAVVAYPVLDNHFRKTDLAIGGICKHIEWYFLIMPFVGKDEARIKVYREADLKNFVDEFFNQEEKESLNAMKYYERIYGNKPSDPTISLELR